MKRLGKSILVTLLCSLILITQIAVAEPRSGYEFIKPETRVMQDDDFANPGLLAVERGEELFNEKHEKGKA